MGEADHTETDAEEGKVGPEVEAESRAAVPGVVEPGAAAHQPSLFSFFTLFSFNMLRPDSAIGRCSFVAFVPFIQAPLPHIAVHILT